MKVAEKSMMLIPKLTVCEYINTESLLSPISLYKCDFWSTFTSLKIFEPTLIKLTKKEAYCIAAETVIIIFLVLGKLLCKIKNNFIH